MRVPVTLAQVKDPTSDIAVLSRKGSTLLRDHREKKERNKMRCVAGAVLVTAHRTMAV